jgi:hypothetical protein
LSSSLGAGYWQELSRGRVAFAQLVASPSPGRCSSSTSTGSLGAGDWQELSRGRVAFAQLAAELKRSADLQRRISGLLGATPSAVDLLRYGGDGQERVSVTATEQAPWGKKHVAMVRDDEVEVIEEYVSR